jgi:hypothetical protein
VIESLKSGLQAFADDTPEAGGQRVFVPGEEGKSGVPWNALQPSKSIELVAKDPR